MNRTSDFFGAATRVHFLIEGGSRTIKGMKHGSSISEGSISECTFLARTLFRDHHASASPRLHTEDTDVH